MTEDEAWAVLNLFAGKAQLTLRRSMTIGELRRGLAKVYQPRKSGDDESAMRQINPAIDVIDAERDRRELLGIAEPGEKAAAPPQSPPWQTEPLSPGEEAAEIESLQKAVYQRSSRFGGIRLVKAWAWDGQRFRKVVSAKANPFAFEELARELVRFLSRTQVPYTCQAVFLTEGEGRAETFRLVLVRLGRGYEAVTSYNLEISLQADDPTLPTFLNRWLDLVREQLLKDLS